MWWIPPIADPRWLAAYYGARLFPLRHGFHRDRRAVHGHAARRGVHLRRAHLGVGLAHGIQYRHGPARVRGRGLAGIALPGGGTVGWLGVAAAVRRPRPASLWVVVGASGGGFDPDNRDAAARAATRSAGSPATSARGCPGDGRSSVYAVAGLGVWVGPLYVLPRSLPVWAGRPPGPISSCMPVSWFPPWSWWAVLSAQPAVPVRRGDLSLHLDDRRRHPSPCCRSSSPTGCAGKARWSCPWA